jgi:hypothetical protein
MPLDGRFDDFFAFADAVLVLSGLFSLTGAAAGFFAFALAALVLSGLFSLTPPFAGVFAAPPDVLFFAVTFWAISNLLLHKTHLTFYTKGDDHSMRESNSGNEDFLASL